MESTSPPVEDPVRTTTFYLIVTVVLASSAGARRPCRRVRMDRQGYSAAKWALISFVISQCLQSRAESLVRWRLPVSQRIERVACNIWYDSWPFVTHRIRWKGNANTLSRQDRYGPGLRLYLKLFYKKVCAVRTDKLFAIFVYLEDGRTTAQRPGRCVIFYRERREDGNTSTAFALYVSSKITLIPGTHFERETIGIAISSTRNFRPWWTFAWMVRQNRTEQRKPREIASSPNFDEARSCEHGLAIQRHLVWRHYDTLYCNFFHINYRRTDTRRRNVFRKEKKNTKIHT